MTGPIRGSTEERLTDVFVESPSRANKTAIEVFGSFSTNDSASTLLSDYQEAAAIVSGVTTLILTHTFSSDAKIHSVCASGENIAMYELFVDSVLLERKRTYFGSSLDLIFDYGSKYDVLSGAVLELKVVHNRPMTADFNATLKYLEAV